jgi:hypothetical protein
LEAGEKRVWSPGRNKRLYKTEVRRYGDHGGGEVKKVEEAFPGLAYAASFTLKPPKSPYLRTSVVF